MRLHNITRSSNIRGRGNCGKPKSLCAIMIFQILSKRRNCGKRRGFMWMKCYLSIFRGFFRHFRPETRRQGKKSCRCGILPRFYRWKTLITCPPVIVEKFLKISFPQACGGVFHSFPRLRGTQKTESESNFGDFWSFTQKITDKPVQNLFFPHTFPQLVEKLALFPKQGGESVENSWENRAFSTGECRQLPLTSLTISSISARKTGF